MSRRIDVELTSRRDDGSWTWRAAGAKAPKGVVESSLLPADAQVGHVLRVEIETYIDGISILAVLPPKSGRTEPKRLELLGPRSPERLVTTTLAPRGRGDRDRPRRPRDGEGGERREGGGRREAREGGPRERRGEGGERRSRPDVDRRPPPEPKPKAKRLRPGRTHRRELIAGLPEEQRPIAEELSRGGIPGVRAALEAQNAQAKAEGHPEINPAPLLALAEELWPRMRSAEWLDRAEAAVKEVDELDLRDLRSVVVAADSAARDDESRALAAQLREALTRRVDEEHLKWLTELAELVAENRIVAALRRSSRPPKAGAPLPSDLARLLIDRTSEALNAEVAADRWAVLLDALSFSPVRSSVSPVAVPENPNEELLAAVRKSASRLPHIASQFGVEAPPVPAAPSRGGRRGGARSGGRPDRSGGGAPVPPPPPLPAEGQAAPEAEAAKRPAAEATSVPEAAAQAASPVVDSGTGADTEPAAQAAGADTAVEASAEPTGPDTAGEASAEPAGADTAGEASAEPAGAEPAAAAAEPEAAAPEPAAETSERDAPTDVETASPQSTPDQPASERAEDSSAPTGEASGNGSASNSDNVASAEHGQGQAAADEPVDEVRGSERH